MKRFGRILRAVALVPLLLFLCLSIPRKAVPLRFYFLDVGQGDATLIRTAEGDILIDTGPDAAQAMLMQRLSRLGVERLLLLVLSHADEDHIGGADAVLSTLTVDEVWLGADEDFGEPFARLLALIRERDIPLHAPIAGDVRTVGGATMEILSPIPYTGWTGNNGSLGFRFCYGEIRALFLGDVEGDVESEICRRYARQLQCDVFKVPHHGAYSAADRHACLAAQPKYAVIFCEEGNSYGHPHGEQLALLRSCGAEILRTDRHGEIMIEYDGTELVWVP